jgi:hypothetical protein
MPNFLRSAPRAELFTTLCMQRQMTSLMERHIAVAATDFEHDNENWVRMWLDPEQVVRGECGAVTAHRGITDGGDLLWLVRHCDKKHGYHSAAHDPVAAMDEARFAWEERRRVRARWDEVRLLADAARAGRYRQTVRIEDAYDSALCATGVRAFMTRMGLARYTRPGVGRMSARKVGYLMLVEPQVGFVLMRAFERRHGDRSVHAVLAAAGSRRAATSAGFGMR